MPKIKLTLTEDHLKLIRAFRIQKFDDQRYGIDITNLYGGNFLFEDMSYILGWADKVIPETKEDWENGPRYEKEYQQKMEEYDEFILANIVNIQELLCQFLHEGLSPGVYWCIDREHIWHKEAKKL